MHKSQVYILGVSVNAYNWMGQTRTKTEHHHLPRKPTLASSKSISTPISPKAANILSFAHNSLV